MTSLTEISFTGKQRDYSIREIEALQQKSRTFSQEFASKNPWMKT